MDRGLQLLREGTPVFDPDQLPEVAADTPVLADDSKAILRVPPELSRQIHPQADFYVDVHGDSTNRVGCRSNDIVAVKRNPDPANGEVVIARIGVLPPGGSRPDRARPPARPRRGPSDDPDAPTVLRELRRLRGEAQGPSTLALIHVKADADSSTAEIPVAEGGGSGLPAGS